MHFRAARPADIPQIQIVRHSVRENVLSNPALVTDADCEDYLTRRGKGWVAEVDGRIVGFSIVSVLERNVWALFVHPDFEGRGVGKPCTTRCWPGISPKRPKRSGWARPPAPAPKGSTAVRDGETRGGGSTAKSGLR